MTRTPQPEADKARALKLARYAATKTAESRSKLAAAMLFAKEQGASLREIADATDVSHVTVKRMVEGVDTGD